MMNKIPQPRILTEEEVEKYALTEYEKFALIDKTTDHVFLGSNSEEFCVETLIKMTVNHRRHKDMELVKKP